MVKELTYKIAKDVKNGIFVSVDNFLVFPEVKAKGIVKANFRDFIIPSTLFLVGYMNSSAFSSPICMCVSLNHINKLSQWTNNSLIHTGLHRLPTMLFIILQYRISIMSCLANIP